MLLTKPKASLSFTSATANVRPGSLKGFKTRSETTRRVEEIGRCTALTCLRDGGTLDWNGSCGNVGLEIIGKYVVIKASAVDKVAHRESRECEGKRAINSSEQHPHPRGHQKQEHLQKELEEGAPGSWRGLQIENIVSLKPREERFKA